jgi:ligand-binding sensor domain-containing protein
MKWKCIMLCCLWFVQVYAHQYKFRALPNDFGADVRQVNQLFQSADGIIWIGTDLGLYYFDGRRYQEIRRKDGIQSKVTAISAAPDGLVWAGYEDGYIIRTSFHGPTIDLRIDSLAGTAIAKIVFATPGNIYVCTYGKGLWQGDGGFFAPVLFDELTVITDIYDAFMGPDHKLWLATDDGVRLYNPFPNPSLSAIKREQGMRDDIVTRLLLQQDGNVLVGLYDLGIQEYRVKEKRTLDILYGNSEMGSLLTILEGADSTLWVSTTKSIWMRERGGDMHELDLPPPLRAGINAMLYDRDGNLWVASGDEIYVAYTQIEYINPGITSIQAVLPLNDKIWYGCESGLYVSDMHGETCKEILAHAQINVLSLYADKHGFIWVGTFGQGLYIVDPKTGKSRHLTEADQLSNSSILNIDGRDNKVWLATLGGITEIAWSGSTFDRTLTVSNLQNRYDFPPGYVYDVFVANDGRVWFGTDGKGLFYLDDTSLHKMPVEVWLNDSITTSIRTIYSIAQDKEDHLWISTYKGMVLRISEDMQVLEYTTSPQGLVNSLVVDGNGDLLVIREGEIGVVRDAAQVLSLSDAMDLSAFAPNINATALDKDGTVLIADANGLLHYHPLPQMTSKGLLLNFESISPGHWQSDAPLRILPDSNFLDIRYVGLWYPDPAAVHYRYKLEGHDLEWIYTQERRAVYSRLSPGTYRFIVQAARGLDFANASQLEKALIVLPPFYQRWWFIALLTVLIGSFVFMVFRSRINRLRKLHLLEKEKTTHQLHAIQAQVNPHFLFNSFNTLSSIIEEDQQAAVDYVDQLAAFFRGALMHRDDELIPISQEMEIVRNYTYILRKRYGDNITIHETIENTTGLIAPLSVQLLVENAIKHNKVSSDKPLSIYIGVDAQWVEVSNPIQPKFQPANESTGFGLSSLVTRYAYLTPRKIDIRNVDHQFTVRIPVLYPDQVT